MNEQNPNQDYQTGYLNGIEGQDQHVYESYVSSQVNYEWILERLASKNTQLQSIQEKQQNTRTNHKIAFDKLQVESMGVNHHVKRMEDLNKNLKKADTETTLLEEKRLITAPRASLLAGLIFLIAGISFIAGDLIISHEIVAYALNIRNNEEAWAFAIGLAMLSILLKPAYDRLIEEPYHASEAKNGKSRYAIFKLVIALFTIGTLLVLGWFRYEAYRTDKLKESLNKSIKALQLNSIDPLTGLSIDDPAVTKKIEQALQESDKLNLALVDSNWALLSFVLSGLLFAIAGAVCLGLALPTLQSFWLRWLQIDPKLWMLKRSRKKITHSIDLLQETLTTQLTHKHIYENEINQLPRIDDLKEEEYNLRKEIEDLESQRGFALANSRIAAFNNGYENGKISRQIMTEAEYNQWKNSHLSVSNLALRAQVNASGDKAITRNKSTGMRPYQSIRKAITDQFDENQS